MCSFFFFFGGGKGGSTTIYLMPCNNSTYCNGWSGFWLWPVECWSTPLQWLCKVARYWQELEHAVIYADPERHKHAQWVTSSESAGHTRTGTFQLPGIVCISLQYGAVYHAATWADGGGWMASGQCKCTCVRWHTPAYAITPSTNRWPTRRHTHWTLPCPEKTRTHPLREHLLEVPDPIKCEHSPTAAWYDDEPQADGAHKEDDPHAD